MTDRTASVQRTMAVLALTAITAPLEIFSEAAAPGTAFDKQLRKVARWRDDCAKLTRGTRLSSGAQRDIDARLRRWAELAWVGAILATDVMHTCPEYGKARPWIYLDMTAWTLGRMLMQMAPGCDEGGTAIYMALYGYEWGEDGERGIEVAA